MAEAVGSIDLELVGATVSSPAFKRTSPATDQHIQVPANAGGDAGGAAPPAPHGQLKLSGAWDMAEEVVGKPPSKESADTMLESLQAPSTFVRKELAPVSRLLTNSRSLGEPSNTTEGCLAQFVVLPEARIVLTWDLIGLIVLTFDAFNTPLIAFRDQDSTFDEYLNGIASAFWALDLIFNFFRARHVKAILERRLWKIAKMYLSGWFLPDATLVFLDMMLLILRSAELRVLDVARSGRFLRFLRTFRFLRLLRVIKFSGNLDGLLRSFIAPNIIVATKCLVVLLLLNHFVACGWYALGRSQGGPSWISQHLPDDGSMALRYSTALHWSVTQFTPSSTNVHAHSTAERIFSIAVILTAVGCFSTFVGSLTGTMAAFIASRWKQLEQRQNISRFLDENDLSSVLRARLSAFISGYKLVEPARVRRKEIVVLRSLPKKLDLMLDWEMYSPILRLHPLFLHTCEHDAISMLQVCNTALTEQTVSINEELFCIGQQAKGMYFTLSGFIRFFVGLDEGSSLEIDGAHHTWLSEPSLWMKWVHRGQIFAVTGCDFLMVQPEALNKIVALVPALQTCFVAYRREFCRHIAMLEADGRLDECGDVDTDFSSRLVMASEAFGGMPSEEPPDDNVTSGRVRPTLTRSLPGRVSHHERAQTSPTMRQRHWNKGARSLGAMLEWLQAS